MKIKAFKLVSHSLDWAVELALGTHWSANGYFVHKAVGGRAEQFNSLPKHAYSTDWSQSGPILSEARISRTIEHSGLWIAYWTDGYGEGDEGKKAMHCDSSELVAGLRCYVEMNLGNTIDVPNKVTLEKS